MQQPWREAQVLLPTFAVCSPRRDGGNTLLDAALEPYGLHRRLLPGAAARPETVTVRIAAARPENAT